MCVFMAALEHSHRITVYMCYQLEEIYLLRANARLFFFFLEGGFFLSLNTSVLTRFIRTDHFKTHKCPVQLAPPNVSTTTELRVWGRTFREKNPKKQL